MKARFLAWFYGLQQRERWIVTIGAVLFVGIVGWGLVLKPLRAEIARLQTSVDAKQRLLIDVARVEVERPTTVVEARPGANQPLVQLIPNTAGTYGLEQPRTRANGPSGVDVTLQNASFDAIMVWLVALHDGYGIDVETASFTPAREPGFVNGSLLLRRL
jgi:type II secretory pathway component PulM